MTAWQQVMTMAEVLKDSKALPSSIQNQAQLAMVLLSGKEAGMGAMESLNSYYIVNGKVTIYGAAVMAQLRRAGYRVKWGKCDAKEVALTLISPSGDEHNESYTMEQAVKAGNTSKEVWQKYPVNMLRYKCLGNACRFFAPEVLYGHYIREEMDGNAAPVAIDAEVEVKPDYPPISDSPIIDSIVPDTNPNRNHK
jgi:hypothetical protein